MRDSNLYTLIIRPGSSSSSSAPDTLHLVERRDASEEPRYTRIRRKVRADKVDKGADPTAYDAALHDAYSGAELASVQSASAKAKTKRLMLHSPDVVIPFESTGTMSFEWTFIFEDQKFRWRRDLFGVNDFTCVLDRRPDPAVEMCIARSPAKGKDGWIQLIDYNLGRFEIKDPKGLELSLYASLISLIDGLDDRVAQRDVPNRPTVGDGKKLSSETVKVVADEGNPNEVIVQDGSVSGYADRCVALLADPSILFIIIRSKTPKSAAKAVEVADATKRARHRAGLDQDTGLWQYVVDDPPEQSGPKVIDLNDKASKKWQPPSTISVFLSKIDLPDLNPSRRASTTQTLAAPVPVKDFRRPSASGGSSPGLEVPGAYPASAGSSRKSSPGAEAGNAGGGRLGKLFRKGS